MSRQSNHDNRANQMNPNNDAFWQSRGFDERPDDWEDRMAHLNEEEVNDKNVSIPWTHSKS